MTVFSRRSFLAVSALVPHAIAQGRKIPVGLELYSVRNELRQDLEGAVRAVAAMGYECVEFYSPYLEWSASYAKQVRKLLDDLGIKCYSTHNSASAFDAPQIDRAIELNHILGSKYIVMASPGAVPPGLDNWKRVVDRLNAGAETMRAAGLRAGFHNHQAEFRPVEGRRPIDVIAQNTPQDILLQLDVGTCLQAGEDPVAFIRSVPGRVQCVHCKDWSRDPAVGFNALFGEGSAPWREIFAAAESVGGVEFYLIEQETSPQPMEAVKRCLENFRKLRA